MAIDGIGQSTVGARRTGETREAERPEGREGSGSSRAEQSRGDSVEISAEARVLADSGLTPERVEKLRSKIAEGAYNRPSVAEDVARRLLASGDMT